MKYRLPKSLTLIMLLAMAAPFTVACSTGEPETLETSPIPPDDLSNGPWTADPGDAESGSTTE